MQTLDPEHQPVAGGLPTSAKPRGLALSRQAALPRIPFHPDPALQESRRTSTRWRRCPSTSPELESSQIALSKLELNARPVRICPNNGDIVAPDRKAQLAPVRSDL